MKTLVYSMCFTIINRGKIIFVCRFPVQLDRRDHWIQATGRKDFQPAKHDVLCSDHFVADDFEQGARKSKLMATAMPSVFQFPDHLSV